MSVLSKSRTFYGSTKSLHTQISCNTCGLNYCHTVKTISVVFTGKYFRSNSLCVILGDWNGIQSDDHDHRPQVD